MLDHTKHIKTCGQLCFTDRLALRDPAVVVVGKTEFSPGRRYAHDAAVGVTRQRHETAGKVRLVIRMSEHRQDGAQVTRLGKAVNSALPHDRPARVTGVL